MNDYDRVFTGVEVFFEHCAFNNGIYFFGQNLLPLRETSRNKKNGDSNWSPRFDKVDNMKDLRASLN